LITGLRRNQDRMGMSERLDQEVQDVDSALETGTDD